MTAAPASAGRIAERWSRAPIPGTESPDQPGEVALWPAGDAGTSRNGFELRSSADSNQPPDRQTACRKTHLAQGCLPSSNAQGDQEPDSVNLRLQTEPLEPLLTIVPDGAQPFVREVDGSRVARKAGPAAAGWPSAAWAHAVPNGSRRGEDLISGCESHEEKIQLPTLPLLRSIQNPSSDQSFVSRRVSSTPSAADLPPKPSPLTPLPLPPPFLPLPHSVAEVTESHAGPEPQPPHRPERTCRLARERWEIRITLAQNRAGRGASTRINPPRLRGGREQKFAGIRPLD